MRGSGRSPGGLLIAFCLLWLAGCAGGDADAPLALEPAQLRYVTFNVTAAGAQAEEVVIEEFQTRHPGVTVERTTYNQPPATYLADLDPPDVMLMVPGDDYYAFVEQGLLAEISPVWDEVGLSAAPATFQHLGEYNGNHYFLPVGYVWHGIYFNREIFARNGIEPPATWENFLRVCAQLLDRGETPMVLSGGDFFAMSRWFDYLDLRLNGPDFHRRLLAGEISYQDPGVQRVLETFRVLFDRGCIGETYASSGGLSVYTPLVRGDREIELSSDKAVMALASPPASSELPPIFQEELDFFPFPVVDPAQPRAEMVISLGYMVPSRAANLLAALAFLEHLASPETQTTLMGVLGSQAAYVPVQPDIDPDLFTPQQRRGMEMVQAAGDLVLPSAWGLPGEMRAAYARSYRRLAADEFDVIAVLADLENARQATLLDQP